MSRVIEAKWAMLLLAVMMSAIVVLSGPVGEALLGLPEPTAEAKKKKKKKKKRPPVVAPAPEFNLVDCAQQGTACNGTPGNDLLVGTSAKERIQGGEGNDVYDGKNGQDTWFDSSTTSNDTYLAGKAFEASAAGGKCEPFDLLDNGGGTDTVDFSTFSSNDIALVSLQNSGQLDIRLNISQGRTGFVSIIGQHENEEPRIENFKFSDRTFSAQDMKERSQL